MEGDLSVHDAGPDNQLDLRVKELANDRLHAALPNRSLARSIAIVATCTGAMFVNVSNSTSVAISLPEIGKAVNIQEDQLQWLLSAYALSSGCLLLLFGRLADLYGRKKGFLIGMCWQAVFALGLGFSNNGITLDVLRGFQGMGAAAAIPAAVRCIAFVVPDKPGYLGPLIPSLAGAIHRVRNFRCGAPMGGVFGNIIGGVLTQLSSEHWRAPFYLSSGLSALCISPEVDRRVDWIGAILVTSDIIACLVIGVILVGTFMVWEHHLENRNRFWTPPPLMKLSIWARAKGRMSVVLVIAFLNWAGFISWIFWVQLYYQNYLGLTPVLTMVRFLPMFVMGCLCNFLVAILVAKLSLGVFVVLGTLVTGLACVLFALIDPSTTYWAFSFPSTVMVVFGADFVYAAGTIFVSKIVFSHEQSVGGGLFQTMTQIGTAFGLTITTLVFDNVVETQSAKLGVTVDSTGTNAPKSAQLQGYRSAQWANAAFPFLASLLAVIFLRQVGIIGYRKHGGEDPSEQTITEQQADPQP
ncbi:major facilitator superfamily domain-containing protein [Boletus coccyginus]|nr:major facilitator superfamily domain-containing protein [Boletus coccyginus]